jgi:hypothetical protein
MEYTVDVIRHKKGAINEHPKKFYIYREVLAFVDRFTATGAPLGKRHVRILPLNQYICWPVMFGMKWLQFTDYRRR